MSVNLRFQVFRCQPKGIELHQFSFVGVYPVEKMYLSGNCSQYYFVSVDPRAHNLREGVIWTVENAHMIFAAPCICPDCIQ